MKKSLIMFLFITIVLAMLVSGCSDDKKSSTGPGDEVSDSDYLFNMIQSSIIGTDVEYYVTISSPNESEVNSTQVIVNSETYNLIGGYGTIILPGDGGNSFEVIINGTESFEFDFNPVIAVVDWPNDYDSSVDFTFDWTLYPNVDADLQYFSATGVQDNGSELEKDLVVDSTERSVIVPSEWYGTEYTGFQFSLATSCNKTVDELYIQSLGFDTMDYDSKGLKKKWFNRSV